jgi:hypothetical protein
VTSSDTIRAAFVQKLQAIDSLVSLLGNDPNNIVEFIEETEGDSFGRIYNLRPPKLLVIFQGIVLRGGPRELWQHNFMVVIRPNGSPSAIFKEFVDGIPSTGSQKMLYEIVVPGVHSMEVPTLQRRVIPVSETSSFDYWEIMTGFSEMEQG